jgi:hypothetical protein
MSVCVQTDDQMLLLQSCWAELHILDYTYHRIRNGLCMNMYLNNGQT